MGKTLTLSEFKNFVHQWILSTEKNKPHNKGLFANHICNIYLTPRTYKKLLQLNNKKTTELKYGEQIGQKPL